MVRGPLSLSVSLCLSSLAVERCTSPHALYKRTPNLSHVLQTSSRTPKPSSLRVRGREPCRPRGRIWRLHVAPDHAWQNGGRSAAEAVTSFIVSVRRDGRSFLRRRRLPGADRRRRGRLVPISRALPTAPHERPHALASVACGGPHRTRWDRATMASIKSVHARAIFDSRGNPTVEVDVTTDLGTRCARRRSRRAGSCSGSGCRARAVHRR